MYFVWSVLRGVGFTVCFSRVYRAPPRVAPSEVGRSSLYLHCHRSLPLFSSVSRPIASHSEIMCPRVSYSYILGIRLCLHIQGYGFRASPFCRYRHFDIPPITWRQLGRVRLVYPAGDPASASSVVASVVTVRGEGRLALARTEGFGDTRVS